MSDYHVTLNQSDLVELLTENGDMAKVLTDVLNQVLDAQCRDQLRADRYERNPERQDYRNGYRPRQLYTRVGPLTLQVPQTREGTFSTDIFQTYQRSEKALVLSLMEMYLQGVSTRKVTQITEELCGTSFAKSTVSELSTNLDATLQAWRDRDLSDKHYPFLIVDAMVIDVRRDQAIRNTGVLMVYGINESGQREPLDFLLADSECEASWQELFHRLKQRGLKGVDLVVSDAHEGLVNALKHQFQGARWQRCQTHLTRNVLGQTPRHLRREVADRLKLVFQAERMDLARKLAHELIADYETKAPKAMDTLENGLEHALTVLDLPQRYRKRLRTTNLAERMNSELRRRQRVVRIFPDEASAERLIGALLQELYEQWHHSGKRYLDMNEYWAYRQEKQQAQNSNVVTMKSS